MLSLVALQFAGAIALFVLLVLDVLVQPATWVPTAIALVVVEAIATVALGAVLVGIWRGRAWVRSLGIVLQVLIAAIGLGALQGAFAQPDWGWPLVTAGVVGVALFLSPPVARWLSRRGAVS